MIQGCGPCQITFDECHLGFKGVPCGFVMPIGPCGGVPSYFVFKFTYLGSELRRRGMCPNSDGSTLTSSAKPQPFSWQHAYGEGAIAVQIGFPNLCAR